MVNKVVPPLTHEQRVKAVKRALAHAASLGVTSVQNMDPDYEDIAVYSELLQRGELTTRIYAAPLITQVNDQTKIGIRHAFGGPFLRIGAVKAFADGSLGSVTAYCFQPFDDQPSNHGILSDEMHPVSLMRDRMMKADAAGLQLCTHAIGDQAISMILDIYSEITKAHGEADRRFRIEHAQHMAAKDFDRFAQLHVIASVQPYHAIDDGRWAEGRIGHDRATIETVTGTIAGDFAQGGRVLHRQIGHIIHHPTRRKSPIPHLSRKYLRATGLSRASVSNLR